MKAAGKQKAPLACSRWLQRGTHPIDQPPSFHKKTPGASPCLSDTQRHLETVWVVNLDVYRHCVAPEASSEH